ncbi:hypothetical protein NE237_033287 [Protea cynaroides]|uniref:Stigma-specific STIG1-like protein 1 n=1 Tax=Protea cynaroides TaxID=273540 RepID=A0A9Q0R3X0_9MAGN|nr:hypothetical protein NE237_033287 [Protea cynaroides]
MESMKVLFLLLLAMVLLVNHVAAFTNNDDDNVNTNEVLNLEVNLDEDPSETDEAASQSVISRFLAHETFDDRDSDHDHDRDGNGTRTSMSCDKYPRICHKTGSAGPDCCQKHCVNVMKSVLNCGWCGHKCKYAEICCRGKCVNARSDSNHCGGCHRKCGKGKRCSYGLCHYA